MYSQSLVADLFSAAFLQSPNHAWVFPDSLEMHPRCELYTSYFDVYSNKAHQNGSVISEEKAIAAHTSLKGSFSGKFWLAGVSIVHKNLTAGSYSVHESYTTSFDQSVTRVVADVAGRYRWIDFGLACGTDIAQPSSIFSTSDLAVNYAVKYPQKRQLADYKLLVRFKNNGWVFGAAFDNYIVNNSVGRVENATNHNFRTFSLAGKLVNYKLLSSFQIKNIEHEIALGYLEYHPFKVTENDGFLPIHIHLEGMQAGLNGSISDNGHQSRDTLAAYSLKAITTQGTALANETGNTFFIVKPFTLQTLFAQGFFQFSHDKRCGIFADVIDIRDVLGSLDLSGFSAWSFLDPTKYLFRNGHINYWQSGVFYKQNIRFSLVHSLNCHIGVSRFELAGKATYKERHIMILLPIYTAEKELEFVNTQGWMASLALGHYWRIGSVLVETSLTQSLPIPDGKTPAAPASEPISSEQTITRFIRGGTQISVRLSIP